MTAPPSIENSLVDQTCVEGQRAIFEAEVKGIPFPQVDWSKDGTSLKPNKNVTLDRKNEYVTCSYEKTNREDSGFYQLQCSNPWGLVESKARLTIHGRFKHRKSFSSSILT